MFSQWCFKIKKSLKKQRLRNGSATESIYRSPWELHPQPEASSSVAAYIMLGSPTGMMMRVPVCFSPLAHLNTFKGRGHHISPPWFTTSFFNKNTGICTKPMMCQMISIWNLSQWNGPKKTYLIGAKSIVPDFASASEVNCGHFMTCFLKKMPGSRCVW